MKALHWLPIKQRIQYKLCLLVHLAINGKAPSYLRDLINNTSSMPGRALQYSTYNINNYKHLAHNTFGTFCILSLSSYQKRSLL